MNCIQSFMIVEEKKDENCPLVLKLQLYLKNTFHNKTVLHWPTLYYLIMICTSRIKSTNVFN